MTNDEPGFSTLSIHAGARPDPTTGARITPIYQTTAFVFDDVDHAASLFGLQAFGNIYTRITNPTTAALEERVAALEGAPAALAVASGHAAQAIAFHSLMQPGDEFVASTKLYGGSINQFNHAFKNFGWMVKWADPDDLDAVKAAVGEKTKAIFIESIANPGGVVTDIAAIAAIAKAAKIPLIVDNTLATPYLIRPLEHGADIVVHSATKYLCGHGNSMGGVIVDGAGRPIGMVTASSGDALVATPGWLAEVVSDELISGGRVVHGWLGITGQTAALSPSETAVKVLSVSPGGAAAKAGVRAGDMIEAVNGEPTRTMSDMVAALYPLPPDRNVTLDLDRHGRILDARARLSAAA